MPLYRAMWQKVLEVIRDFPKPSNLTGARVWFGLENQVAYSFAQTEEMAPFRDLLKRNRQFFWDSNMDALFEKSKVKIVELVEEGFKRFEMGRPTCLATDFSRKNASVTLGRVQIVDLVTGDWCWQGPDF